MANNNNEGADNSPDNTKDSGLDKSIVGKFMSGIINSTPLSKWFGKDSTSKSTIRRREDDEEYDSSYVFQPPSKRAKLPSDVEHNNYSAHVFESPTTVHNASNNVNNVATKVFGQFPEPIPGPSGIQSRKLFQKHHSTSTNSVSTISFENQIDIVNGENDTDSEESTSGYSSAPKLVSKENIEDSKSKETLEKTPSKSRSLFNTTNDFVGSRTLFPERSPQINTSLSSRRPNFNASTFGSPNFVDRTLSTKRILSSPFYSGHTIYGGASAYGRRLGKSGEDSKSANRISVTKPINEKKTTENATLSKTARRILSTLEQYSTPISDAKKIPVSPRKPGMLSNFVGATPYLVRDRKKPSNRELQVPTVPELLQMKQKERLQNSTETVRQIATKSKSSLNKEEYKLRTEEDNKQKHSNKMKSNVVSVRQKAQPIEPVSNVKLPKVSLPITTLPKFDFVLMPPSNANKNIKEANSDNMTKSPVSTIIKPAIVVDKKETEKKTTENVNTNSYTFSEPVVISKNLKPITAINCFKFSEPLLEKQTTDSDVNFKTSHSNFKTGGFKLKNNGETMNFGKPANQLSTGSVMDILRKKDESSSIAHEIKTSESTWECSTCLVENVVSKTKCSACDEPKPETSLEKQGNEGFGDQFKVSSDKWECNSCMVRNNNSDNSCVACTAAKPANDKLAPKSGFGDKFKPPASTWECTSCLIRNKNDLTNCAACGTAKTVKDPIASSFGDKFKPSSDTWECGICMIRNKNDADKCAACETPKPGSKTISVDKTQFVQKTSGVSGMTFSFGVKPEWECKTCMIKNKNDLKKCAACEMPRDSGDTEKKGFGDSFKMKGGEWECTSCLVKNKPTSDLCVCCGVAKPGGPSEKLSEISKTEEKKPVLGFNFGIDTSSTTQFKFGIPTTTSEPKDSNITNTPTVSFGDSAKTVTSTSFSFGINTQEKKSPTKTVTSNEPATQSIASNPLLKPNEKLPEKASLAPVGFKFGLDSSLNKNQGSETVVSNSGNKIETSVPGENSTSIGSKSAPMFQFKPPAINGDVNKPNTTNKSNSAIFSSDQNKPKEPLFGTDLHKNRDSPLSNVNKPTDAPFGNVSKPADSPFTNASKSAQSPFTTSSKATESPFVNSNKPTDSPFGNTANKPSSSPFATSDKPTVSPFGNATDSNKPKESFAVSNDTNKRQTALFGEANKPQIFGADAYKPKEVLFGNKPTETNNLFSNPTSTPTFTFTPKPIESSTKTFPPAPTSQPMFAFGGETSQNPVTLKRPLGDVADTNVSNGFGSVSKIPAFGSPQGFGSAENKPFSFTSSSESAPKNTGFSFGQTDKTSAAGPVFNFGGGATPAPTPSGGFNFPPAPSSGFNFGSAAKVENQQPFNTSSNVFGAAGTGAKNGSFNFGTNSNNNNQKAVFSFGANLTTSQPTQPSFPSQNQAGFNFGKPATQNVAPGFNFAGAPPTFNFTDGNAAAAPPQRKIKKALRRTHR